MHRIIRKYSARESSFYAKNQCRHALHKLKIQRPTIIDDSAMQTLIFLSGFNKYHVRYQINVVLRMSQPRPPRIEYSYLDNERFLRRSHWLMDAHVPILQRRPCITQRLITRLNNGWIEMVRWVITSHWRSAECEISFTLEPALYCCHPPRDFHPRDFYPVEGHVMPSRQMNRVNEGGKLGRLIYAFKGCNCNRLLLPVPSALCGMDIKGVVFNTAVELFLWRTVCRCMKAWAVKW